MKKFFLGQVALVGVLLPVSAYLLLAAQAGGGLGHWAGGLLTGALAAAASWSLWSNP